MKESTEAWILGSVGAVKGVYEVFIKPVFKDHPEVLGMFAVGALVAYSRKYENQRLTSDQSTALDA